MFDGIDVSRFCIIARQEQHESDLMVSSMYLFLMFDEQVDDEAITDTMISSTWLTIITRLTKVNPITATKCTNIAPTWGEIAPKLYQITHQISSWCCWVVAMPLAMLVPRHILWFWYFCWVVAIHLAMLVLLLMLMLLISINKQTLVLMMKTHSLILMERTRRHEII